LNDEADGSPLAMQSCLVIDRRFLVKIPVQRNFCRVNLAVPEQAAGLQYRLSVRDRWLSGNGIVEETQ
jgi:hypothetical protein